MIHLTFSALPMHSDPQEIYFIDYESLDCFIREKYEKLLPNKVFLFTIDSGSEFFNNEVLISHDYIIIVDQMEDIATDAIEPQLFWQEYESYEDAYSVALTMKEIHPLCYNK
jgi:hypothetical protein